MTLTWIKIITNDTAANYDVSRQTGLHLRDKSTRNLWDVLSSGQSPLFSTLLATAVQCYTLTIRELANSINAKRQVRKGVLAWAFGQPDTCNVLAHNKLQPKKQNCQMSRGSKIIHIPENIAGSKTIHPLENRSWFSSNSILQSKPPRNMERLQLYHQACMPEGSILLALCDSGLRSGENVLLPN